MIELTDVVKRYGSKTIIHNISFDVKKGEIVGFLGPNGAGKTTTMRILTCFLPPTRGGGEVGGFDVLKQPLDVKRRIGYLPETPPLYPEMEVIEYLNFALQRDEVINVCSRPTVDCLVVVSSDIDPFAVFSENLYCRPL